MSPIFTFIAIALGVFAIFDIIVGVANDAVNFLNSAIGSRIAKRRTILCIAAFGILIGTLTSSGMMEVARSGVFYPGQFTFAEIMVLFLGMIVGDIILLDIFNSLGLPTSTTVSMVFGLLGAAVAVAIFHILGNPDYTMADMSQFINSGKAMVIISGILLSVVFAFVFGLLFMYLSRLIFSFRYNKIFSRFGALWCGISFTGIIWFSIFKGLKSTGLISAETMAYISDNNILSMVCIWLGASAILFILQMLKVNILRITILAGTFALALAFAGNDLVNFIGVPLAGMDSYFLAQESGNEEMLMTELMNPAKANFWVLAGAGLIMVLTLFLSKKAMHVTETELALSNQNSGNEKFGSSGISRGMVRVAMTLNNWYKYIVPKRVRMAIERRFEQLPPAERGNATYDLIRATVNLSAAAILISVATSFKLPLSTTYVVFMVAMGSSLADRAWGRESAVYRITGVLTVISGWFITAIAGFTMALVITSIMSWGGNIAIVAVVILCLAIAIKSNFITKKKKSKEHEEQSVAIITSGSSEEILYNCTQEVLGVMEHVSRIYNRTLVATFKENRKVLKSMVTESKELYEQAHERKYGVVDTMRMMQSYNINNGHFYVQITDYLSEVTKALAHITRPAYDHINNHHQGLSKEQILDLMRINDEVELIFGKINEMLRTKDFSELDAVLELRDNLFGDIADAIKHQLHRIKENKEESSTRSGVLYLNILTETKTIILQARNLIKSQRYFIENRDDVSEFLEGSEVSIEGLDTATHSA